MRPRLSGPKPKLSPNSDFTAEIAAFGYSKIIGVDEVGRGAIAGPVVVAAVEINAVIPGITDSKLISRLRRPQLAQLICRQAVQVKIGQATAKEVDTLGMSQALELAYTRTLANCQFDLILTDNYRLKGLKHVSTIKGDQLFYPVSAASIVAKVFRDQLMGVYHGFLPQYAWNQNAGYGTKQHIDSIKSLGTSPLHRLTFINKEPPTNVLKESSSG